MPFAIGIGLEEHGARGEFGCIGGNGKRESRQRMGLDRNSDFNESNADWHWGVQFQARFLLVKSIRGRAMKQPKEQVNCPRLSTRQCKPLTMGGVE